jgi:glycosyltransferase involved in cell wall biosynthesis
MASEMANIALLHDWLTGFRGGEKVLLPIASLFPQAPLYTLFYQPGTVPPTIESRDIHASFLNRMPFAKTHYRHYLPLFPLAAETLIPKKYDLLISTSHAVAKSVNTRGAKHWCYIHSPMRYVWDRFDDYFGPSIVGQIPSRFLFAPIASLLRIYDRATVNRVGHFVANSHFVKQRVRKFYEVDCEVIHPPVETSRFLKIRRQPEDFYLFFSALVPYKKADQAIQACLKLKRPLKILGKGPELKKLRSIADSKFIEFIENPTDLIVDDYYSRAKALLFPGVEDFGIVPVEASASGLPVIAFKYGGVVDSQTEHTCEFYNEQTVEGLIQAILQFDSKHFEDKSLRENALRFSEVLFKEKVKSSIHSFANENQISIPNLIK